MAPPRQLLVKILRREARITFFMYIVPPWTPAAARRLGGLPIRRSRKPSSPSLVAGPVTLTAERPLRDTHHLRRFGLLQLAPLMPLE
jgi:hypothetical protein